MRLNSLKIRGLGPFSEVDIDLAAIDAKLIAITGGNGEGKSTLLELFAGAIYRRCATRGKLAELATTRDAFVEASIVTDHPWTIRQLIDGTTGKGEASVIAEDGSPAIESGKVRDYDRWAADHLPKEEVLYSTIFTAQGHAGFVELKPADRKGVLLRVLGIEHLEVMADRAKAKAKDAKQASATLTARLEDERRRGGDVKALEQEKHDSIYRLNYAGGEKDAAETALKEAQVRAQEVDALLEKATEHAARRQELQTKRDAASKKLEDLKVRIENNLAVLGQGATILEAIDRDAELAKDDDAILDRHRAAADDVGAAEYIRDTAGKTGAEAAQRVEKAKKRLKDRDAIEKAVAEIDALRVTLASSEEAKATVDGELEEIRGRRIAGAEDRIRTLRFGLEGIATNPHMKPAKLAKDTLDLDDKTIAAADRLPGLLEDAMKSAGEAQIVKASSRKAVIDCERLADRAGDLADAAEDLAQAEETVATAAKSKTEAEAIAEINGKIVADLETEREKIQETRKTLSALTAKAERLTQAEIRIEELTPQEAELSVELFGIDSDLTAIPSAEDLPDPIDLSSFEEKVETTAKEETKAAASAAVAEKALANAKEAAEARASLEAETKAASEILADWTRLAHDFGRDGLQALEIDAAGPELTELVNDLLHSCFGSRWTVSIDTTRESADGKRQLEGLDVMVIDTEKGREGLIETYSGGERVILGEAVSMGLTTLSTRRSGITGATLIRDESGAALEPKHARAYIAMLRRAADLTGAAQVLYVSHTPEIQELADARIHIEDGRVKVV